MLNILSDERPYVLGGDPGKTGSFALLSNTRELKLFPMPYRSDGSIAKEILFDQLLPFREQIALCAIEAVVGVPGMHGRANSSSSNFNFGVNKGTMLTIAELLLLGNNRLVEIHAVTWQKKIWAEEDRTLNKEGKSDPKATSAKAADRLFGLSTFIFENKRTPHDGSVDAALIAEYVLRLFTV